MFTYSVSGLWPVERLASQSEDELVGQPGQCGYDECGSIDTRKGPSSRTLWTRVVPQQDGVIIKNLAFC